MSRDPTRSRSRVVLVGTPIGNLDDVSPRAQATLADADVVAAEDTRHTGRLLAHLGIDAAQVSYHDHNESSRAAELVARAAAGETVAVVSDAGTPSVADPGLALVRAAVDAGVPVEAVPGPAAFLLALVLSGLPTDRFAFEGFLPRQRGARRRHLAALADEPRTLVWYVAPHRAAAELADAADALGQHRRGALARELTKRFEEVRRGPLGELAQQVASDPPRGELTLVVAGAAQEPAGEADLDALVAEVQRREADGVAMAQAVREVAAAHGVRRRALYEAVLAARG
jgi:16S rRNA (cytidine1402-2'-O)-methyltransferase